MRALPFALAILLATVLGGCANLQVQVDVLAAGQVDHVIEQAELRRQYSAALSESQASLRNDLRVRLQPVVGVLQETAAEYRRQAATATDPQVQETLGLLAEDLEATTVDDYLQVDLITRYLDSIATINQAIRDAAVTAPPQEGESFAGDLAPLLRQRLATERRFWGEFEATLGEEIGNLVRPTDANLRTLPAAAALALVETSDRAQEKADDALRTNIGRGRGLEDSPYAYAVAKAPEEVWARNFNNAFGTGMFGNLDLAIKLQRTASFTVKGLTFDPRKVAEVASKVATQSVLLAAQISGVPVGLAAGADGGAEAATVGLAEPSGRMATLAANVEARTARLEDRDQALRDIASAILAEETNLAAGGTAAQQARDALGRIYQANAVRLDLSGVQ